MAASNRCSATRGRVLLLTSNFPRGEGDSTTPFILHLGQDLQALGWHIDVLAPHAIGAALEEQLGGVHVERFRYLWPERAQTICYQGGALINLREKPSNFFKVPFLVAAEWAATLRRLRRKNYDLVHSHWILPQGFVGAFTARPLGIPHVLTVHGGDIFALRSPVLRPFKRFALGRADAITVNSSVTRDAVVKITPDLDRRLHLIPMGVTTDVKVDHLRMEELRTRHRRGEGPLLVYAGRLVEEKGVEDLIRSVALLLEKLPDCSTLILGDGQHRRWLESLASQLGLSDRITFAGWVPSDSVPHYLAAADVFIAPSRRAPDGWIEAQGLTILEAMAAGIPVISTRLGGVVDAVIDGETGLLVRERSPEELAAAVERLVRNPSLADRLSTSAHQLANSKFSRASSARAFSDVFEDVIGRIRHGFPLDGS
jgi:phosphatidylinositol alpha-1,6-mannosyltransferase